MRNPEFSRNTVTCQHSCFDVAKKAGVPNYPVVNIALEKKRDGSVDLTFSIPSDDGSDDPRHFKEAQRELLEFVRNMRVQNALLELFGAAGVNEIIQALNEAASKEGLPAIARALPVSAAIMADRWQQVACALDPVRPGSVRLGPEKPDSAEIK